ncbi:hypothetical protein B0H19DRAFT_1279642 [Mycena capillaripes]|nr:hypothetical protein B0H19DRAFT_1279642 [Mycena capillaripes]
MYDILGGVLVAPPYHHLSFSCTLIALIVWIATCVYFAWSPDLACAGLLVVYGVGWIAIFTHASYLRASLSKGQDNSDMIFGSSLEPVLNLFHFYRTHSQWTLSVGFNSNLVTARINSGYPRDEGFCRIFEPRIIMTTRSENEPWDYVGLRDPELFLEWDYYTIKNKNYDCCMIVQVRRKIAGTVGLRYISIRIWQAKKRRIEWNEEKEEELRGSR